MFLVVATARPLNKLASWFTTIVLNFITVPEIRKHFGIFRFQFTARNWIITYLSKTVRNREKGTLHLKYFCHFYISKLIYFECAFVFSAQTVNVELFFVTLFYYEKFHLKMKFRDRQRLLFLFGYGIWLFLDANAFFFTNSSVNQKFLVPTRKMAYFNEENWIFFF